MSESPSTVNWNDSKVEAKPDIATNSLSDNRTAVINYKNAKYIRIQELTDSKLLSKYENLEGYDLSYLLKSNEYRYDIELPFTSKRIHILFIPVLLSDIYTSVGIYIDSAGTWTPLNNYTRIYDTTTQQTKEVYYDSVFAVDSIRPYTSHLTVEIVPDDTSVKPLVTMNDDPARLIFGFSRLIVATESFEPKAEINSYGSTHHYNNMVILPSLISTSFKRLMNTALCSRDDYIYNMTYSYNRSSSVYRLLIEQEADYVILTTAQRSIKLLERSYREALIENEMKETTISAIEYSDRYLYPFHANKCSIIEIPVEEIDYIAIKQIIN